jgi:uncharacterized membrane protein YphA (DoxX/SURF4 family)
MSDVDQRDIRCAPVLVSGMMPQVGGDVGLHTRVRHRVEQRVARSPAHRDPLAASHIWTGDDVKTLVGPAVFLLLTAASWALRPPARRDLPPATGTSSRGRSGAYWVTTTLVAAELAVGGIWDLLRTDYVRDVIEHLGYPAYLLTIMGAWKLPGAVVLLLPRFPRLKQWAYAGATINYASAVASHVIVGDGLDAIVAPLTLLALTIASCALYPPGIAMVRKPTAAESDTCTLR